MGMLDWEKKPGSQLCEIEFMEPGMRVPNTVCVYAYSRLDAYNYFIMNYGKKAEILKIRYKTVS